jgi:hypothetical protein
LPTTITIQGLDIEIPDQPKVIDGQKRKPKDQYFRRTVIPEFMETVILDEEWNLCNLINEGGIERKTPLTADQENFINREIDRCINGYWFMRKGEACYITGIHYDYLNYWTLEDGCGYSAPDRKIEYRTPTREFFLFFDAGYNHPTIKGIVRGKKVREGATSEGTCASAHIASFFDEQICGTLSDKGPNAKNLFTNMICRGFYDRPVWLQPRYDNSTNSQGKIKFVKPAKKVHGNTMHTKREGLNSEINWQSTSMAAYVTQRLSFILVDETGRWEELDINQYCGMLTERFMRGASKVGFAYLPTAVNPPEKGGRNFSRLWINSNQHTERGINTVSGFVRWFVPAYEGLSGFVDQYGDSVVNPPDKETLDYLLEVQSKLPKRERIPAEILKLGAKRYLEIEVEKVRSDPGLLSDRKRNYPMVEADMFDFGDLYSPFNLDKVKEQINWLTTTEEGRKAGYWRRGRLVPHHYDTNGTQKINVQFHDDPNGLWLVKEFPKRPNAFTIDDYGIVRPGATDLYGGGMDTVRFDETKELSSNAVIMIGAKLDVLKPEGEDGGNEIAFWCGRPKLTELIWEQMLLAELYWGCTCSAERDATQEYIKYHKNIIPNFMNRNCLPMLGKKPDLAIDPNRKVDKKIEYGASSADKFVRAKQTEVAQVYIEKYVHKMTLLVLLYKILEFNPDYRTPSDEVIAWMMMLLNICGDFRQRAMERKIMPMIESFTIGGGISKLTGWGG